ncbi:beta-Ala-His dipeptidase [Nakamurella sp. GG22]
MPVLESLQPQEVLRFFEILSNIPRGSENEKQAADWVVNFAEERGLEAFQDDLHCVVVRKPGQGGLENAPGLILHGHLDMVCAKEEGVDIDFVNEPIKLVVDGDYIAADGTSLGADNGIGVSYILALLDSKDLPHPPLEAVLTAMEEKGKVGAGQFDTSVLTGTRMIDFNWITDNEILAGCSGDITFLVDVPAEWESVPAEFTATRSLKVRGLQGGHCEFDIHLERANAILLLARVLNAVLAKYDVRISGLYGGTQNSAIPADAEAVLSLRPEDVAGVEQIIAELGSTLYKEYELAGDTVRLEFDEGTAPEKVFSADAGARFSRLTALIANGVLSWSLLTPGVVESSNNLGTLRPTDDGIRLASTITAQVTSRKHEILDRARVLAALAGGGVTVEQFGLDAPEFPYQEDSQLLKTAADAYRDVIGKEPDIHVSQCSLELGMFSRKIPGLEIISIGTELHGLHSPAETVNHTSVAKVWPLVREVVSRLN